MKNKKLLALLLVLCLMICLLPAAALADGEEGETDELPVADAAEPEEETAEASEEEPAEAEEAREEVAAEADPDAPLAVAAEETAYPLEGETVYNNGGTVYNNGGLVYNNGGTVYLNAGTVYNNGGVVFANGGVVYNNGGTVYHNGARIYTFEDDGVVENRLYGYYTVDTAEDYSELVSFEGLTEENLLAADGTLVIRPLDGLCILSAEADAGELIENRDGSWTLTKPDADLTLTLVLQALAPEFDLAAGTYGEEQQLIMTGPQGAEIYYTLNGEEPREDNSLLYEEPIALSEGCTVSAVAILPGAEPSPVTTADFAFVAITAPELEDGKADEDPAKPVAFTVENPGSTQAVIESVTLSGKNPKFFVLSTEEGGTVKAGKTDKKTWTIQAADKLPQGIYTATVIFTLDSGATAEFEIQYKVN